MLASLLDGFVAQSLHDRTAWAGVSEVRSLARRFELPIHSAEVMAYARAKGPLTAQGVRALREAREVGGHVSRAAELRLVEACLEARALADAEMVLDTEGRGLTHALRALGAVQRRRAHVARQAEIRTHVRRHGLVGSEWEEEEKEEEESGHGLGVAGGEDAGVRRGAGEARAWAEAGGEARGGGGGGWRGELRGWGGAREGGVGGGWGEEDEYWAGLRAAGRRAEAAAAAGVRPAWAEAAGAGGNTRLGAGGRRDRHSAALGERAGGLLAPAGEEAGRGGARDG
jgi:hypothetical protein